MNLAPSTRHPSFRFSLAMVLCAHRIGSAAANPEPDDSCMALVQTTLCSFC
jgi:hypothetical protein